MLLCRVYRINYSFLFVVHYWFIFLYLTYLNILFAQVLTALPLSVHPAELVEAIWAVENYDPQYMRVIMYGMKTPLEFVNFRLLDEIVTAVFEERPRCANQFDIAVSHRTNSIITVKVPVCPPDGATSTWRVENFQLFNCVEARPTADSCLGGCSNIYYDDVPGLDPAIKKTKLYALGWHLICALTSCKFKSVDTVKKYRDRINVLNTLLHGMECNQDLLGGLRCETRFFCLVSYYLSEKMYTICIVFVMLNSC